MISIISAVAGFGFGYCLVWRYNWLAFAFAVIIACNIVNAGEQGKLQKRLNQNVKNAELVAERSENANP